MYNQEYVLSIKYSVVRTYIFTNIVNSIMTTVYIVYYARKQALEAECLSKVKC